MSGSPLSGIVSLFSRGPLWRRGLSAAVLALYLWSIWWAWRDARARGSRGLWGAALAALLPAVGLLVWLLVRPDIRRRWRRD